MRHRSTQRSPSTLAVVALMLAVAALGWLLGHASLESSAVPATEPAAALAPR